SAAPPHSRAAPGPQPFGDALLGQPGVWPWSRPLSRGLFSPVLGAAGPAGPFVARAVVILVLAATTYIVFRIGERLLGRGMGAVAGALFASHAVTKFLMAWASGFQDVLATALTLGSLFAYLESRRAWSLLLAALAPFAKETGFIAAPLVLGYAALCEGERRPRRWMAGQIAVAVTAVLVHLAVRATWSNLA